MLEFHEFQVVHDIDGRFKLLGESRMSDVGNVDLFCFPSQEIWKKRFYMVNCDRTTIGTYGGFAWDFEWVFNCLSLWYTFTSRIGKSPKTHENSPDGSLWSFFLAENHLCTHPVVSICCFWQGFPSYRQFKADKCPCCLPILQLYRGLVTINYYR